VALIDCPECGTQVSSAAPSCPKCGFPVAQEAQKAVRDPEAETSEEWKTLGASVHDPKGKKKPMSTERKVLIGFIVALTALVAFVGNVDRPRTGSSVAPARDVQEAQRCDSYKKGIKAAMPDLFNGDVRREIECGRSTIKIRIRGSARRQPDAERVLALTVSQLAEQGINPRRDEVALALFIYQTGKTVTGGPGSTELTSAWYSPVSDSVERLPAD
jgi:hypothetical protein